jgi:hypothetical protein
MPMIVPRAAGARLRHERHGFEAIGSIQVADSPRIIAMLRKPRPMS